MEANINVNSEQALLDAIIADAEAEAAKTLAAADEYYAQTVDKARVEANEYIAEQAKNADAKAEDVLKRRATLAALETKKTFLAARQALVEEVFSRAQKMLSRMDDADYLKLLDRLIAENAVSGDVAIISAKCALTPEQVEALESAKKLGLKVEKTGAFEGGLILSGEKFDKDLTFKVLCESMREKAESEVAQKLFG